jgi:hypothetical protein
VDHSARVDDEVGGEEDPGVAEPVAVLRARELVVRRARDRPAAELWDRDLTEHFPGGARREDVALRPDHVVGVHHFGAELVR